MGIMKVLPLSRVRTPDIGLVVSPTRVIGEWDGETWNDIPPGAKLYTKDIRALWGEFLQGHALVRIWNPLGKRSTSPTAFKYRDRTVSMTRGVLSDVEDYEAFGALITWADVFRNNGANIGSIAGSAYSLWRATLTEPAVESVGTVPYAELQLGGRQGLIDKGVYDDALLWDLSSAYAHTLGTAWLPRVWKRYRRGIPDGAGFVRAVVTVAKEAWGPLPIHERGRMVFPTATTVEGLWTADEIRAALAIGSKVDVQEAWYGDAHRPMFARWWDIIKEARATLRGPAARLLKASANTVWGSFAAQGHAGWVWWEGTRQRRTMEKRMVKPNSMTIAALIASRVRSRLYTEALCKVPVIACHTDGVITFDGVKLEPNTGAPGCWRLTDLANTICILSPQTYRYVNPDGEIIVCIAGSSGAKAERRFKDYMLGMLVKHDRQAYWKETMTNEQRKREEAAILEGTVTAALS